MNRVWTIALAVLAGAPARRAAGARAGDDPEMMETWQKYSTPEHHQMLNGMVGKWTHKVTMWMTPDGPPMESTATSTAALTMDGRWLEETFEGHMWGMPFGSHNLLGYDNFRNEYVSVAEDNLSTAAMVSRGTFDPATKSLTMTATMDDFMSGARTSPCARSRRSPIPHATMEMFMPGPDGQEFRTMRIEATKVE